MCIHTITRDPAECQYARLQPDLSDEPGGYICTLSRNLDGCSGSQGTECPVISKATPCPRCSDEDETGPPLLMDEEQDLFGCNSCGAMMWGDDVDREWAELEARRDRAYFRRMIERSHERKEAA